MSKAFVIFGGFNPPTIAHVNLSNLLLKKYPDALIVYQVAPLAYFTEWKKMNESQVLSLGKRIQLLKEALPKISNIDVLAQPWLHAIDNMHVLHASIGLMFDLHIVIGADKVSELHTWYEGVKLVEQNKFLVVTRNNEKGKLADEIKQFADHFEYIKGGKVLQDVSSTKVRNAYFNDDLASVKKIIPANVYQYLSITPGLFGKDTEPSYN